MDLWNRAISEVQITFLVASIGISVQVNINVVLCKFKLKLFISQMDLWNQAISGM